MRIFVFSDSHGRLEGMRKVMDAIGGAGAVLHAGDVVRDARALASILPCPVYYVRGNNDFASDVPLTLETELDGNRLLLAHGHTFRVRQGTVDFLSAAKSCGARIAVYGHTHAPLYRYENGVHILNPGTMMHTDPQLNTFGLIETDGGKLGIDILKESNF